MKEGPEKQELMIQSSLVRIFLVLFLITILLALFIPVFNGSAREPQEVSYEAVMRQLALAIENYESDIGVELPIKDLDEVRLILGGKNGRGKVYFPDSPFVDQYGRDFVIDNGQIVHRGDDSVLGTDDDIRAVVKKSQ